MEPRKVRVYRVYVFPQLFKFGSEVAVLVLDVCCGEERPSCE